MLSEGFSMEQNNRLTVEAWRNNELIKKINKKQTIMKN
jgi:hypothetical protein